MITLNTSSIPVVNYNKYQRNNTPSFTSSIPKESAFLNPLKKGFDKLTDKIAQCYTGPLFSSKITNWLAKKDNIGRIVDHMQAIGSYVISGMYMFQTLRNDNMDEDRRVTLAINQGLTLLASTAIAYFISNRLEKPWDKHVSAKYAANKLGFSMEQLEENVKKHQEKIKNIYLNKHPEDVELKKFKKPDLAHYIKEGLDNANLAGKLKGLAVLKSLIIFSSVYRFFGPVAVTPVATWLGNKLTGATKKIAPEQKTQAEDKQDASSDSINKEFNYTATKAAMARFLAK